MSIQAKGKRSGYGQGGRDALTRLDLICIGLIQTKDIVYVQQFLGHKTINHTLKYIQFSEAMFHDENNFTVKVAKTHEEAIALLEAGFNKVDEIKGLHLYRKIK